MNDKGHFYASILKSGIRILFCLIAWVTSSFGLAMFGLILAEVVGIFEEVLDNR